MRNFKLKDGYTLGQDIKGDGVVNLVVKKIDGSEDDVIVGQVIDGKYVIDTDKPAKLVYESDSIYASESTVPGEDFDIITESELSNYVEISNSDEEDSSADEEIKDDDSEEGKEEVSDESDESIVEEESIEE